jgi:hypothetical protein
MREAAPEMLKELADVCDRCDANGMNDWPCCNIGILKNRIEGGE